MDRGIVDPDELLVEQWAQEASSDVIHGHAAAELVEGWHDDRLFREFQITLVFPQKRDPHPARDNLSVAHRISECGRGMIVSHDEDLRLHDLLVRPCVAMAEAGVVEAESVGGLEPDVAGHDVFQHPVMVPLRDVDLPEHGREIPEEHVHIPSLARRHLRDEMLHIAKDDDATRTAAGCDLGEFPSIASARLGMWTPFSRSSSSSPIWRSATTSASSAMRTGSSGIGSRSTVARREESA